jgi:GR25 family glycosyltransferase involved in LPS biosynthesis
MKTYIGQNLLEDKLPNMNILNQYYDKIFCINLDRRDDRWLRCIGIFKSLNLEVERFSAFDGQLLDTGYGKKYNGELGGTISHTRLIKKIIDEGYERVLILEDDVEFSDNFLNMCQLVLNELPENWDILFYGGNHTGGYDKISEHLIRVYRTYALHCYAVNKKSVNLIYEHMIRFLGYTLSSNEKLTPSVAADYYMANLHPTLNVYCARPHIAWQRESFSDLQQIVTNYEYLK